MFNKNNLLIYSIAGKEESRVEISGINFKKNKTVATDSYKLIEVKNPDEMINDDEFPQVDKNNKAKNFNKQGYILPVKSVKKILANLNDVKTDTLPILKNCIFLNSDNETSKIATTDLDQTDIVKVRNIQGQYPDCNAIIPNTDKGYIKTKINIKYLKEVVDVISKMNLSDEHINLLLSMNEKPMMIKTMTKEKQSITGLIMPVREPKK